jgi:aminobenzoyl-glutamate transport protein
MPSPPAKPTSFVQRALDFVERVGNKVPHPVVIFLVLIAVVAVLSHVLSVAGTSVSYETFVPTAEPRAVDGGSTPALPDDWGVVEYGAAYANPSGAGDGYSIERREIAVRSLLTTEGVRFAYTSLIPNFMGFTAVGLMIVAMLGAGVAEESGLVKAVIRMLVAVSPRAALTYVLAFVGVLSSIGADAGYLVLIPLGGSAFLSLGRHPIAGLALAFAAVAGAFTVNILIKPLDAVLVEFTNDAIHVVDPDLSIGLASNLWFSIASVVVLTLLIGLVTEKVIEPRLGKYQGDVPQDAGGTLTADEARGLRFAAGAMAAVIAAFALLTLPAGAPLRNPDTGELIGQSPFMGGLIAVIMTSFLATGAAYGVGARTLTTVTGVIKAIEKAISGLGGLIFLLLVISQFVAYFNFTNLGTILALTLSDALKSSNIGPLPLLLGFIATVALMDFLITGAIAKWAIFAPIFVPLLVRLGVDPEAVLAAYRIGDSPVNAITPLNAYFALVVGFTQKYDQRAGVGTVISLMIPYVGALFLVWTTLFTVWFLIGLPWGL